MFFTIYVVECTNTIVIFEEIGYENLKRLELKFQSAGESYTDIKGLRPKTIDTGKVCIRRQTQLTIEDALGTFLYCESVVDKPLSEYFKNIGMSTEELERANMFFQGAKNRALEYLEDYYPKDSSLDMLKRYESTANVNYSESYVQNEKLKEGVTYVCNTLTDIYADSFSVKYSTYSNKLFNNFLMIPFAIIHYLISHGYRIKKCNHCHKYFVANSVRSRRKIYCDRNSPYKGFEHLNCEQAVRNILTKLSRKRLSVYKKLYNIDSIWKPGEFSLECKEYRDNIKKEGSVENLQEYEQFLKNYKIK